MMVKHFFIGAALFGTLCAANASVNQDLNNYFDSLGFAANATGAGAYKGQTAGYYTGGSLYARSAVRYQQMANIQLPSYRAGCGGIDLFSGGLSFINSDELVNMLKSIGNNAAAYVFLLGMQTYAPQIESMMAKLNDVAQKVNQSNINSCETAQTLVNGVWSQLDLADRSACESSVLQSGRAKDMVQARQMCGAEGKRNAYLADAKGSDVGEQVAQNTNIAWKAIQKINFLSSDTELAELFMSLSGTVIYKSGKNENDSQEWKVLPSLVVNRTTIKSLLEGGQLDTYHCDTKQDCLNPKQTTLTLSANNAFVGKVKEIIDSITEKVRRDTPLNTQEIGFLGATRLPIYKMLNVEAAYSKSGSLLNTRDYADIIATDIVYQYLTEALDAVIASTGTLQLPEPIVRQFKQDIQLARSYVDQERKQTAHDINIALDMMHKTQLLEQQLAGLLSANVVANMGWVNTLR